MYRTFAQALLIAVIALMLVGDRTAAQALPLTVSAGANVQSALGTAFTYQGVLKRGNTSITDQCDMTFSLYDSASNGNQVGSPITTPVAVTNSLFTANLDFGSGAFTNQARWLQIAVKCSGDAAFTTLSPRQALTAVPYALHSLTADTATSALAANTALNATTATTATTALAAPEFWRLSPSVFADRTTGALTSGGLYYPSTFSDTINGFAPPTSAKTIESIHLLILDRTGSYNTTFDVSFEVRNFAGTILHTASAAKTDLQSAPVGTWIDIPLSNAAADLVVGPGQYLAVHVSTAGAPGGDLAVYPAFEVKVRNSQ